MVADDYSVYSVVAGSRILIPAGFVFDGASIPDAFHWIIDPSEDMIEASCVHDYLYTFHLYSRKTADRIFKELLEDKGLSRWKVFLSYRAVRIFGQRHWEK